jgi:hypothetical protein
MPTGTFAVTVCVVSRALNDVADIKSAADVELVLSDEVGHIDRVIAGADVIRVEDSASGAAQSCGARG